jgi:3-methyladenine DNA glycosylase Mpg
MYTTLMRVQPRTDVVYVTGGNIYVYLVMYVYVYKPLVQTYMFPR